MSPSRGSATPDAAGAVNGDMYIADGDYIRDIEVNDLRNRYTLTKGSTQKMVNTSCVIYPLIHQAPRHLARHLCTLYSPCSPYIVLACVGDGQAYLKRNSTQNKPLYGIC